MRINVEKAYRKKLWLAVQIALIGMWLSHLKDTDSYFSVYVLCAGAGFCCLMDNGTKARRLEKMPGFLGILIGVLLSFAVTLANYPIFQRVRDLTQISASTNTFLNVYEACLTFAGGVVVFREIFVWLCSRYPMAAAPEQKRVSGKRPGLVFASVFFLCLTIYLVYLFFVVYPGNVTSDNISQISKIYHNRHDNHHPFWHTMTIRLLMSIGYGLFQDVNAAAATFHVVQSVVMAAVFALTVMTLYQYRVPRHWVVLPTAAFAFLPNHITYSGTMWKDVAFGVAVLLLMVAMFRVLRGVGKSKALNYGLLVAGGIGSCVMRTNGWYAVVVTLLVMGIFCWKQSKKLLLPWAGIILASWVLLNPVQAALGVDRVTFMEAMSVPMQQIARVITAGGEFTPEEQVLLEAVLDMEKAPETYTPHCCDPIKFMMREKNRTYVEEHKGEYLKLWLQIGARYPWEYVEAWVEETKGYWNGGYDYYIYAEYIAENPFGIYTVRQNNPIHKLVKAYWTFTRETVLFEPVQSIGLTVWVLSMLCFLTLARKRSEFLLTLPVLAVVFTLWLTTPVFSEFRYAYSLFTTIPFLLPVVLYRSPEEEKTDDTQWT